MRLLLRASGQAQVLEKLLERQGGRSLITTTADLTALVTDSFFLVCSAFHDTLGFRDTITIFFHSGFFKVSHSF
jgi:hypothetical protein